MSSNMMEQIKQYYLKHHPEMSQLYNQTQYYPDHETNTPNYINTQRKNDINVGNLEDTNKNDSNKINNVITKMKADLNNF